ncbi:ricin B lectin domain-containing protein [Kockovaella imperatae]|uniref:Ricin B lectin domain-containing protein n=1 Tax=Kockovaella imperatae TaxID=4999 RepID=A0A1Y1UPD7_9TREE|nr:ricin B lectin domain-containing protein [Kockovaella imperatae]ORX39869.1 ricin B lectin domain-containing protein [Kockovaella imperatae]
MSKIPIFRYLFTVVTLFFTQSYAMPPPASMSAPAAAPSASVSSVGQSGGSGGGVYNQLIISYRDNLCLSIVGGNIASPKEGMAVQSLPCKSATTWNVNRGQTLITLAADVSLALDAKDLVDHGEVTLQKTSTNLPEQTWYFTNDNYIAVMNSTQCLDEGVNGVQLYTCQTNNDNQAWYVLPAENAPDPSMTYTDVTSTQSASVSTDTSLTISTGISTSSMASISVNTASAASLSASASAAPSGSATSQQLINGIQWNPFASDTRSGSIVSSAGASATSSATASGSISPNM